MLGKVEKFIFENLCDNKDFLATYTKKDINNFVKSVDFKRKKQLLNDCSISFRVAKEKEKIAVDTWFKNLIESYFEGLKDDQ